MPTKTETPISQESLNDTEWHRKTVDDTFYMLHSSHAGLEESEVLKLSETFGKNELKDLGSKKPIKILIEQLTAVMVLILIGAAFLSLLLGKYLEAGAIGLIVILFALLGFFQEFKAEKAIAALKKMSMPFVLVMREGKKLEVSAHDLVPGDLVFLEAGSVVPADLRIVECMNLRIEEASLTGESEAVEKNTDQIDQDDMPLGDRKNMAYSGTQVVYGRGTGIVTATGMDTELGKIATLIQEFSSAETPLQEKLDSVGKQLAILGVLVAFVVVGLGYLAGEDITELLLTAISVAVAVIPEGLPAVVTFTLAIGAQRMLKRNALIRKLPAVETLGSVTVICSDKTGTLTQNKMTATYIDTFDAHFAIADDPQNDSALNPNERLCLLAASLCNDGHIETTQDGEVKVIGDPTETSLLVAANKFGIDAYRIQKDIPRVGENPFDSSRKRMSTVHTLNGSDKYSASEILSISSDTKVAFIKGATDGLLDRTVKVFNDGELIDFDNALRKRIETANKAMAQQGLRVLGIGYKILGDSTEYEKAEDEIIFVGLIGIIDPPRKEVKDAVALCLKAGIRPIMITGDHPLTALAIAKELGVTKSDKFAIGTDIEHASSEELAEIVNKVSVFARVSPEHKLRIVQALQDHGNIVAMTGDGVNDAPALKKADIGVAMGITGTDVSKEAADMVLRDDNFATIVSAVKEGRVIYDNLRRFVKFAVAGNIGKILVMVIWPIPILLSGSDSAATALLPLQLLWLNLMTDGLLGLSMGIEPEESGVMSRKPHKPGESIWANGLGKSAVWVGIYIGVVSLAVGYIYFAMDIDHWQTMMFTTLALLQVFQAMGSRSSTESFFKKSFTSNKTMLWIVSLVIALQMIALYTPLSEFLDLDSLNLRDLSVAFGLSFSLILALEVEKMINRRKVKKAVH
jgi:Ca2+-transporting ATPase